MCNEVECQSLEVGFCILDKTNPGQQYAKNVRTHALTLTFREMVTYKEAVYSLISHLEWHNKLRCVFYPEYSDNGRVHFHGFVYETNKQRYHSFLIRWRLLGFVKESKLTNALAWQMYCTKDQHLYKCKNKPVRYDTFRALNYYKKKYITWDKFMNQQK